ncbi:MULTISPECIES: hypothetical protein [Rhizobium]|uniref:hypothetical protein n=1 Tax=Rhizobium TaxID=379 RepID=UPI001040A407|nr:hypothetical protein [Rhizobium leguminosarum]TBZ20987.1 hypothetical protein E0H33_00320 [Rhizobium leguminosarum bv. viciae]
MREIDDDALWLSDKLFKLSGDPESRALVREMRKRAEAGVPLDDAEANTKQRPNDFGMEIVGSVLTFVVLEALKAFWSAYLKKLTDGLATKAAELTTDVVRTHFLAQLEGPASKPLLAEIEARLESEANRLGIELAEVDRVKAALRDTTRLAAELRH